MKKCIKCDADIEDNSVFCEECGARQEVETPIITIKDNKSAHTPKQEQNPIKSPPVEESVVDNKRSKDFSSSIETSSEAPPTITVSSNERTGKSAASPKSASKKPKGKSKTTAGVLGLLLGHCGVNWFYLGKPIRGLIYLAFTIISFIVLMPVALVFTAFCMGEGVFMICANDEVFKKYIEFDF